MYCTVCTYLNICQFFSNMTFIAVHIGAGYHSISKRDQYNSICKRACKKANQLLKSKCRAVEAVVEAIKSLEDDAMTNAGLGSNLNIDGYVECDATVMDGSDLLFGSVGALQTIKNPIEAAYTVLKKQREPMPLGLISPSFLVGEGARKWAIANGCHTVDLNTDKSVMTYNKYKRQLDEHNSEGNVKQQRFDTVGAICIDHQGVVASGVSSGGLILKQEGRVGQASVFGAGCWAQDTVAVSSSGIGEYLVRTLLARECAFHLLHSDQSDSFDQLTQIFETKFFGSPLMKNVAKEDHLAGILGLHHSPQDKSVELFWAHTTATMCIGYMNASAREPVAFISQLDPTSKPGTTLTTQSRVFKI